MICAVVLVAVFAAIFFYRHMRKTGTTVYPNPYKFNVGDTLYFRTKVTGSFKDVEFTITEKFPDGKFRVVCTKGKVIGTNDDMKYDKIMEPWMVNGCFQRNDTDPVELPIQRNFLAILLGIGPV